MERLFPLLLASLVTSVAALGSPYSPQGDTSTQRVEIEVLDPLSALEFHDTETWKGRIEFEGKLPADEEAGALLEVILPGDRRVVSVIGGRDVFLFEPGTKEAMDGNALFQTVERVPLGRGGTFSFRAVTAAPPGSYFRIRPDGAYLVGERHVGPGHAFALESGGPMATGRPLIVEAEVGYAAELKLELPADATADERAALVGRVMHFRGESQGRMASTYYSPAVELEAPVTEVAGQLVVRVGPVVLQRLSYQQPSTTPDPSSGLAPFHVSSIPQLKPTPGRTQSVRVELSRGITLAGLVLDDRGRPVEQASVYVRGHRHRDPAHPRSRLATHSLGQHLSAKTSEDGTFRIHAAPSNFQGVTVHASNQRSLEVDADSLTNESLTQLRFVVESGLTLWGRAVFPDGEPLVESAVHFDIPKSSQRWGASSALTDADGRFQVEGVLDDEIGLTIDGWRNADEPKLTARHRGQRRKETGLADVRWVAEGGCRPSATGEAFPLQLTVRPAPVLRGRVRGNGVGKFDDCWVSVGSARLVNAKDDFRNRTSNYGADRYRVDPRTGAFEIKEYELGPIGIFAQIGRGKQAPSSQLVTFTSQTIPDSIDLRIGAVTDLEGTVVDARGRVVVRATVRVRRAEEPYSREWGSAETDASGRFTIPDLAPGAYDLTVVHAWQRMEEPLRVTVDDRASPLAPVQLSTRSGARVTVAYDLGGGSLVSEQAWPRPYLADLSGRRLGNHKSRDAWRVHRQASLGPFASGSYLACMTFHHGSEDGPRVTMRRPVVLRGGEVTQVPLRADELVTRAIQGRAVDESGEALAGYTVSVKASELVLASCVTGLEGEFLLPFQPLDASPLGADVDQEAPDTLRASLSIHATSRALAETSLPNLSAGTTDVSWRLSTGSIRGRVSGGRVAMARGIWLQLVPDGEDPTVRKQSRQVLYRNLNGFEIHHVPAGSYTLVGWRRALPTTLSGATVPAPKKNSDDIRYEPATEPLRVKLEKGQQLTGLTLTPLP